MTDTTLRAASTDPAPERDIALDMVRRGLPFALAAVALAALVWGLSGAMSVGYGVAIVVANFLLAAVLLTWAARISYGLMMGVALFGYVLRLGLICLAVLAVSDAGWVRPVPLGVTLVVTHLGLLLWELRYVSASLAYPGLRPVTKETSTR